MSPQPQPAAESPATVLVVDDDRDVVASMSELLQLLGYRTLVAYDGDAGVAAARQHRPAVAILDLHMPRMGGVLACTQLRQDPLTADMKLVALTGSDQASDREAAQLAGFDHYLVKPVMVGALLHLLKPQVADAP
jgi:CheY-like chemotaxis protein